MLGQRGDVPGVVHEPVPRWVQRAPAASETTGTQPEACASYVTRAPSSTVGRTRTSLERMSAADVGTKPSHGDARMVEPLGEQLLVPG